MRNESATVFTKRTQSPTGVEPGGTLGGRGSAGAAPGEFSGCLNFGDGGRYWDRTSDPCRVKAVLYR